MIFGAAGLVVAAAIVVSLFPRAVHDPAWPICGLGCIWIIAVGSAASGFIFLMGSP